MKNEAKRKEMIDKRVIQIVIDDETGEIEDIKTVGIAINKESASALIDMLTKDLLKEAAQIKAIVEEFIACIPEVVDSAIREQIDLDTLEL